MTLKEILNATDVYGLSEEEMERLFPAGFKRSVEIQELLRETFASKDAGLVETLLWITAYDGLDKRYSKVLCELLWVDWHHRQEDIITMLGEMGEPENIDCIYEISLTHPDYDDGYSLQKKCIWALIDIGTSEAIDKIRLLAKSDNFIVREFAELNLRDK